MFRVCLLVAHGFSFGGLLIDQSQHIQNHLVELFQIGENHLLSLSQSLREIELCLKCQEVPLKVSYHHVRQNMLHTLVFILGVV